jgi:hypothetical protein
MLQPKPATPPALSSTFVNPESTDTPPPESSSIDVPVTINSFADPGVIPVAPANWDVTFPVAPFPSCTSNGVSPDPDNAATAMHGNELAMLTVKVCELPTMGL